MRRDPPVDFELLSCARELYECTTVPVEAIARMLDLPMRTFADRRKKWKWRGRLELRRDKAHAMSDVALQTHETGSGEAPRERTPAEVAENIRGAIRYGIAQADERLRLTGLRQTAPAEAERNARVLASLVKTLNELQRLEASETSSAPKAGDDDIDLDEFKRDLARRLEALCAEGEDR